VIVTLILSVVSMFGASNAAHAVGVELAQGGSWNRQFADIREMYYGGQYHGAIDKLEDQIEALGNTYSNETLTEILAMVKDYFGKTEDYARFQTLTYSMLEPNRVDRIVGYYSGSPLYDYAKKARRAWMRPASATIRVAVEELDINESTTFRISVKNQDKVSLASPDVSVKFMPEDYVRVEGNQITALQTGKVNIQVLDSQGNILAQREISIREGLAVTVSPEYKELKIKESETFTIQSNKPFSKFGIKLSLEPRDLVTTKDLSDDPEAGKKLINVTAKKPGTTLLKVTDEEGAGLAQATIYTPPVPPSKLWPLVGTGVTVLLGFYAIIETGNANEKFDEHSSCTNSGEDEAVCKGLYDDYQSVYNRSVVAWVLTGVAAAGTGYLWYKWWNDNKAYQAKLDEGTQPISFYIDPTHRRVTLSYRF
jgi:hypothetical protein